MIRRPSTQDLTWLLDLAKNKQLDLDPPYQRRSVWTLKDKQFFLDTIFRNYPSPAIFLHKTIDNAGQATYHVVDGKQRTETILAFVADKIRIAKDYGDVRLDGKKWSDLAGELDLKQQFWNYQITIEQIDLIDGTVVNEVFGRLNRNSRRLTAQELRHAKFEGWLISKVEADADLDEWQTLGVATKARAKRMLDVQFVSELFLVVLENQLFGFDQDTLDELYAKYEELDETAPHIDEEAFSERIKSIKNILVRMEATNQSVKQYARGVGNFYTLWAMLALSPQLPPPDQLAVRYATFMERVAEVAGATPDDAAAMLKVNQDPQYLSAYKYVENSRGASTDLAKRAARLEALRTAVL